MNNEEYKCKNYQKALEETFVAIASDAITQLHGNEPAILENPMDVEGVHQMRVAARRLRALFAFFRPWIPQITTRALEVELRWLGAVAPVGGTLLVAGWMLLFAFARRR